MPLVSPTRRGEADTRAADRATQSALFVSREPTTPGALMLHGMKDNLLADFSARILRLRDKELQLVVTQSNGASFIFALIMGMCADGMWTGYCVLSPSKPQAHKRRGPRS